jgi:chromosome segregation ATPase
MKSYIIEEKDAEMIRLREKLECAFADKCNKLSVPENVVTKLSKECYGFQKKSCEVIEKDTEIKRLTEKLVSSLAKNGIDNEKKCCQIQTKDKEIERLSQKLASRLCGNDSEMERKIKQKDKEIQSLNEKLSNLAKEKDEAIKCVKDKLLKKTEKERIKSVRLATLNEELLIECRNVELNVDVENGLMEKKDANISVLKKRCNELEVNFNTVQETLKNEREKSEILEKCLEEMRLLDIEKDTQISNLEKRCGNLSQKNMDQKGKLWYLWKVCEDKRNKMAALTKEMAMLTSDMGGLVEYDPVSLTVTHDFPLFGSRILRRHNLDITKINKIIFLFPPEIHYMWARILNENDVNSSGVAFIMDWPPLYCL